jgi:hypothetical protein
MYQRTRNTPITTVQCQIVSPPMSLSPPRSPFLGGEFQLRFDEAWDNATLLSGCGKRNLAATKGRPQSPLRYQLPTGTENGDRRP